MHLINILINQYFGKLLIWTRILWHIVKKKGQIAKKKYKKKIKKKIKKNK